MAARTNSKKKTAAKSRPATGIAIVSPKAPDDGVGIGASAPQFQPLVGGDQTSFGSTAPEIAEPNVLWQHPIDQNDGLDTHSFQVVGIRFVREAIWLGGSPSDQEWMPVCWIDSVSDGKDYSSRLAPYLRGITDRKTFTTVAENLLRLLRRPWDKQSGKKLPLKCLERAADAIVTAVQLKQKVWPTFGNWKEAALFVKYLDQNASPLSVWYLTDCYKAHENMRAEVLAELQKFTQPSLEQLKSWGNFWSWANAQGDANAERMAREVIQDFGERENVWPRFEDSDIEWFVQKLLNECAIKFRRYQMREMARERANELRLLAQLTDDDALGYEAIVKVCECTIAEFESMQAQFEWIDMQIAEIPSPSWFENSPEKRFEYFGIRLKHNQARKLVVWLERQRNMLSLERKKQTRESLFLHSIWVRNDDESLRVLNQALMEAGMLNAEGKWMGKTFKQAGGLVRMLRNFESMGVTLLQEGKVFEPLEKELRSISGNGKFRNVKSSQIEDGYKQTGSILPASIRMGEKRLKKFFGLE